MMNIISNGSGFEVPDACSLAQFLERQELSAKTGIAVAVNEAVVPRKEWNSCILQPDDTVLVIKATQGG